jgi:hypothetical protein
MTGGALRIHPVRIVPLRDGAFIKEARADDFRFPIRAVPRTTAAPWPSSPTREVAMRHFLERMLRALLGPSRDDESPAGGPKTEAQELRDKIRKWERQDEEYEAMGLAELARRSRESLQWYRLRLRTLEDPTFRRVA